MHHRRQKSVSNPNASNKGQRDTGYESMQRLRYLNKKPLCLQYNMLNHYSKRNLLYKPKRKEEAFVLAIAIGLVRLLIWFGTVMKKELWNFLVKPADQLFPLRNCSSQESCGVSTGIQPRNRYRRNYPQRYYGLRSSEPDIRLLNYEYGRRQSRLLTAYSEPSLCFRQLA